MIPIAIAFTPNYFVQAATLLRSVLDACPEGKFRVVCLLTEEIPARMQDKLQRMGAGRLEMEFIPLKGRLQGVYIDPRYSEAASLRLLLPELLPELDRIRRGSRAVVLRTRRGRMAVPPIRRGRMAAPRTPRASSMAAPHRGRMAVLPIRRDCMAVPPAPRGRRMAVPPARRVRETARWAARPVRRLAAVRWAPPAAVGPN